MRTSTWNAASELVSIPGVAAYAYDGNGQRIKTVLADGPVEYALYDLSGSRVYTQRLSGAALTQTDYLDLAGVPLAELANGNPTYLHPDLLGSPRLATNSTQGIVWREHYEPYGQKLNGVNEKVGYTGAAYDAETGLTYLQARYYDAQIGRFLSTDPVSFQDSHPYSFNRYAYGYDNPYRYTDPTGRCPPQVCQGGDYNLEGFNAISVEGTRIGAARGSIGVPIVQPTAAATGNTGSSFGQTVNAVTGALGRAADWLNDAGNAMLGMPPGPDLAGIGLKGLGMALGVGAKGLEALGAARGAEGLTYLYQKVGAVGEHLKFGITKNPATRYTQEELAGGRLRIIAKGNRTEMLRLERQLHETLPIGSEERQLFYIQKQMEKGLVPPPYGP